MPVNGVKGRYVRFSSNGRDLDDTNQYIEAEVYGRPMENAEVLLAKNSAVADNLKDDGLRAKTSIPAASSGQPVPGTPAAITEIGATTNIKPAMPKPLFVGTPLPQRGTAEPQAVALSSATGLRTLASEAPTPGKELSESRFRWGSQPGATRTFSGGEVLSQRLYRLYDDKRGIVDSVETGDFDLNLLYAPTNTESYKSLPQNPFHEVTAAPLSTFSIDVDTASYANVRRFLNAGPAPAGRRRCGWRNW